MKPKKEEWVKLAKLQKTKNPKFAKGFLEIKDLGITITVMAKIVDDSTIELFHLKPLEDKDDCAF